jgi:hypothetical protein
MALLTLLPDQLGGSKAAVRSLLEQFARDRSLLITVLANS